MGLARSHRPAMTGILDSERSRVQARGATEAPTPDVADTTVLVIVAGALFASTLGYLIGDQVSEHEHFDRTRTSLGITRHRTAGVVQDLALLRHDVAVLLAQVQNATTSLNQDTAEVKAAQSALAVVQGDVSQQSSRIGSLHACLGGVQQALNALAIDDQATAVSELNAVASSCSAASGG